MIVHRLRLTVLKRLASTRNYCKSCSNRKGFTVAVIGAAGGIGQPLSLLLKQNPLISKLNLYDMAKVIPGVGVDLSHINTSTKVVGYGKDCLNEALTGADIVVIPAGLPRKPGMTRDDLFKSNAGIAYKMGCAIADNCPCALVAIITNPVNSTVPILAEAMFKKNKFDPKKIFGVTTLDLVRAETFCAEINGCNPSTQKCPVIGGHAGATIIPLLSQAKPPLSNLSDDARQKLTKRIQEAGTEVLKAKAGGGSATLSMAYAAARFTNSLLKALTGQCIPEYAYVRSNVTQACYFSGPIILGSEGVKELRCAGYLNTYETDLLVKAIPMLHRNITAGILYAARQCKPC